MHKKGSVFAPRWRPCSRREQAHNVVVPECEHTAIQVGLLYLDRSRLPRHTPFKSGRKLIKIYEGVFVYKGFEKR